jgi:hypothetical protein
MVDNEDERSPLGIIHITVFFAIWLVVEVIYQIYKRRISKFHQPQCMISSEEFEERVINGEQICILNDLVLDLK